MLSLFSGFENTNLICKNGGDEQTVLLVLFWCFFFGVFLGRVFFSFLCNECLYSCVSSLFTFRAGSPQLWNVETCVCGVCSVCSVCVYVWKGEREGEDVRICVWTEDVLYRQNERNSKIYYYCY